MLEKETVGFNTVWQLLEVDESFFSDLSGSTPQALNQWPFDQACRDAQDAKRDVQVPLLPSLIT
ncbi:MAG: hypothetical protein M3H12_10240, partial [Chromatiales bacterium]